MYQTADNPAVKWNHGFANFIHSLSLSLEGRARSTCASCVWDGPWWRHRRRWRHCRRRTRWVCPRGSSTRRRASGGSVGVRRLCTDTAASGSSRTGSPQSRLYRTPPTNRRRQHAILYRLKVIVKVRTEDWVGLCGCLPAQRQSPIPLLTGLNVAQLRWSRPTRYGTAT